MRKKAGCLLLAAVLILCGIATTVLAAPPAAEPSDSPPQAAETAGPEDVGPSEGPEASGEPEGSEGSKEPEEPGPTLEELRDTLMSILGGGEEAQAIRANVDRMIALGDPGGTLRDWLEATIRKYQLESELEQLTGALDAMEASSAEIGAIAQAAAELTAEPDELLLQIEEICPTAAALLEASEFDSAGEQAEPFAAILASAGDAPADRSLAAVRLLIVLKDSGLLDDEGIAAARSALIAELGRLTALCQTMTGRERETMEEASRALAGRANLAEAFSPAKLVAVGQELNFTAPLFIYDGASMLSVKDAAEFLDGNAVEQGDTLAVVAHGAVLELVKGSSDGYLNDKLCKLPAPVLNFDGAYFLPLDTVLECCGMERVTVEGYELICRPVAVS